MEHIIFSTTLSDAAKITLLKLRSRHPDGFLWLELLAICKGQKATASRRLNELVETGFAVKGVRGFQYGDGA